jgi:signal transduction histidine kinase
VPGSSRPTLGVFISSTIYPWTVRQWEGLAFGARALDANLVAYIGGMLNSPRYEGEANVIYDLAGPRKLDGLAIWSGGLTPYVTRETMSAFCDRYRTLPLVSLEMAFPGIPSLLIDNYRGMRDVVAHMIEVHGYRRIAFLRGSVAHEGVEERYRAYIETLAEHGLPLDPSIVSPPSADWDGTGMMRLLLDERRARFDALVAGGDSMLLEALQVLRSRGIRVPEDVGIAGFDDLPEGASVMPPLTSAQPPFFEMGKRAIETLAALVAGRSVPGREVMPVGLVTRRSCGCASPAMCDADADWAEEARASEPRAATLPPAERMDLAIAEMKRILGGSAEGFDMSRPGELWAEFTAEIRGGERGRLLPILGDWLNRTIEAGGDVSAWPAALSTMRRFTLPWLADQAPAARLAAEELWRHTQALIAEAALLQQERRNFLFNAQQSALHAVGQTLVTTFDIEELADIVADELPRLGIPACYLSLYERPGAPAESARLILAYDERGRRTLPPGGILFPSSELAPRDCWNGEGRETYLVLSLHFQAEQIGFVVFALRRQEDASLCEALHRHLSGALKGALLMRREKQYVQELELAYRELKDSHSRLLVAEKMAALGRLTAGLAHEINTPLAATRAALMEMAKLIGEYKASLGDESVTPKDHFEIAEDLLRAQGLAARAMEQTASFVRSVKSQTSGMAHSDRVRFDIAPIVEGAIEELGYALFQGKCKATFEPPAGSVEIVGVPGRLAQAVTNLVTNAIDANAPEGGTIVLRLFSGPSGPELEVSDSGCGIPQENLSRIFDPLFTTKPFGRGSGLGLTIVHDIVTGDLGGAVEVSSRVGEGTTFTLRFPPAT